MEQNGIVLGFDINLALGLIPRRGRAVIVDGGN